jgi:selenide, water dikinase
MRTLQNLFPKEKFPELLVGMDDGDDAAVYRLNENLALIFTLDFFTPIVDDPYDFGSIAAANSMSDVYAMGGDVVLALNICGFPRDMEPSVIAEILRGGADKVIEAGGILSGGHTINDDEPKYGLAVVGFVHPKKVLTKQGARPGDLLVLTKPLGVGIITTALKAGKARVDHVSEATAGMQRLNKKASIVMRQTGVHAMTDVTGFALIGHALEIAVHSKVLFRIRTAALPFLPGAADYADQWLFPGGTAANRQAYERDVRFSDGIPEETAQLLFTPETSGGLLAAVPKNRLGRLRSRFAEDGQEIWVIGEVDEGRGIEVVP